MDSSHIQYRIHEEYAELEMLRIQDIAALEVCGSVSGVPVRRLCENSCAKSPALTTVKIADSVTEIGHSAFCSCPKLEEITLPANLKTIEANAFSRCTRLRRVTVPDGTERIGNRAFYDARNLEIVEIPASVVFIGPEAFENCPKLAVKAEPDSYAAEYAHQHGLSIYTLRAETEPSGISILPSGILKQAAEARRKTCKFTLRTVCDVAGIEIPEKYKGQADYVFPAIRCFGSRIKPGEALFMRGLLESGKPASKLYNEDGARKGYQNGARFIFSREQYYDSVGTPLPCILVENPRQLFIDLCRKLRRSYPKNLRIACITGSVGKTTTKDMFSLVAAEKFKTVYSTENSNGFGSIAAIMQKIQNNTRVYVQEVGAYFPGLIEDDAAILMPDACVVTNIGTSHIDLYGSVENILHDKLALARHLTENGMVFLNMDDPLLRQVRLDRSITWFSADNPAADYYAQNIRVGDGFQEFDVVGKQTPVHIRLNNVGYHNIINAVSAVAFGRWLGVPDESISAALEKYTPAGMRQSLSTIAGYKLYVDCFNSAPNSLESAIKTVLLTDIPEGNRRIAVLGDMLKMGDLAPQLHADTGRVLAKYDINLYLCFGPNMRYMAEELEKAGRKVLHTESRETLNMWLKQYARHGDLLLFKSGHRMYLAKTIDDFLGTAFYITDEDVDLANGRTFETETFTGRIIDGFAKIRAHHSAEKTVTVPSRIDDALVYRIGANSFSRSRFMTELILEEGVSNIGREAFSNCKKLKKVTLPKSLKIIDQRAFHSCAGLRELFFPEGVHSIAEHAFYGCTSLRRLYIGKNVAYIGEGAFEKCPKLTVYGDRDSYAEAYCSAANIPFEALSSGEFLSLDS